MTVRAMKAGVVEFLTKPFRDQELLDAIEVAIEHDRIRASKPAGGFTLALVLEQLRRNSRDLERGVAEHCENLELWWARPERCGVGARYSYASPVDVEII
jgi:FixJ family two-component response regulator